MPTGGPNPPVQSHSFLGILWQETGLDPRVIWAWANAEGAYAPGGTGGYNYLNLRAKPDGRSYSGVPLAGVSPNGFAKFRNPAEAATETAYWINKMPNYQGIRQAGARGDPKVQLAAIAASPWDAGHYGGGKKLTDIYNSVPTQAKGTLAGFFDWLGKNSGPLGNAGDFWDGIKGVAGGVAGVAGDVAGAAVAPITAAVSIARAGAAAIGFLMVPEHWLRIGQIVGGGFLVLGGVVLMARSVGAPMPSMPTDPMMEAYKQGQLQGARREGREAVAGRAGPPKRRPVYLEADKPRAKRTSASSQSDEVPF